MIAHQGVGMAELLSKLAAQMEIVRGAPLPFALAVIAAAAIISLFFTVLYSTTITSKDSQIALWKDRAEGWEKTRAAMPELQRLLARRWEPLTTGEAVALQAALRKMPKPNVILVRCGDSECAELRETLVEAFRGIGWEAQHEGEST